MIVSILMFDLTSMRGKTLAYFFNQQIIRSEFNEDIIYPQKPGLSDRVSKRLGFNVVVSNFFQPCEDQGALRMYVN